MNKYPLKKLKIFNLLKKINKTKLGREKIRLDQSLGRFLDETLISKINLPPFNNSAVDGYAISKVDILLNNKVLICNHRIAAGDSTPIKLKKGEAIRIFTGAQMPLNSQTVVMQENVKVSGKNIFIKKMPSYGENCRLSGEDIKKKQKILSKGNKINSINMNIAGAIGKKYVFLKKKFILVFILVEMN